VRTELNFDALVEYFHRKIEESGLGEALENFKAEFDLNPFDHDEDEWVGPWQEFRHNIQLVSNLALSLVQLAESILIDGRTLNSPQKHKLVVKVLDDMIRLPWYIEPLDGPVLDMLVTTAVTAMNGMNWFLPNDATQLAYGKEKVEIGDTLRQIEADAYKARIERLKARRERQHR